MNSKVRASRRAERSRYARAPLLALALAGSALGCSVYDESLRQAANLPVANGGADDGGSGAPAGGAGTSSGGAGTSLGGELVDAGAPGAAGDSGEPTAGASNAGGAGGANGGTGGVVVSAGSAGMSPSGGGNAAAGGASAGAAGASGAAATELGVGKPTTASTQQPANPSSSGNDGQAATRWSATTAALPQWWRVDLGANHTLSQVALQFEFSDRKYTYAVETSADDASYTARANVVEGIGATQVVPIPGNVSARYVRITCTSTVPGVDPSTGMARPTWVSFWEASVQGL